MSKARRNHGKRGARPGEKRVLVEEPPRRSRVVPFTTIVLVVLLVLYVAAHLMARTAGFRAILTDRLEQRLGMPVSIGRSSLGWDLSLWLGDVRASAGGKEDHAGFEADGAKVTWAPAGIFEDRGPIGSMEFQGLDVNLQMRDDGAWEPEVFAGLAGWLVRWGGFDEVKEAAPGRAARAESGEREDGKSRKDRRARSKERPSRAWDTVRVSVRGGAITWWGTGGAKLASAEGVDLDATPLFAPQRRMNHYRADIRRAEMASGRHVANLAVEILLAKGHQVLLSLEGDWTGGGLRGALSGFGRRAERQPEERAAEPAPQVVEDSRDDLAERIRQELEQAGDE